MKVAAPVNGSFAGLPEGAVDVINFTPYQITYVGGDGNDVVLNQTTNNVATSTTVTASPNPVLEGQPVTLTANVNVAVGIGYFGGSVDFYDGTQRISVSVSLSNGGRHVVDIGAELRCEQHYRSL